MRRWRVTLYYDSRYVDYFFEAPDYWDARRMIEMKFTGVEWNYLTEC